jgi:hypothetical protein
VLLASWVNVIPLNVRGCERLAPPALVLLEAAVFGTLISLAMHAYPGGTAWEPLAPGHHFWLNYLCDLERRTALDGRPNELGAALAQAAMVVLGLGSLVFWRLPPALFPARTALGRAVRGLGSVSAAGIVAVGLLPSDHFPALHPPLMLVAGGTGIAAAAAGAVGLSHGGYRPLAAVGAAAIAVSGVDLALYFAQFAANAPAPRVAAVLERVALLVVLLWRALIAVSVARRADDGACHSRPYSRSLL